MFLKIIQVDTFSAKMLNLLMQIANIQKREQKLGSRFLLQIIVFKKIILEIFL